MGLLVGSSESQTARGEDGNWDVLNRDKDSNSNPNVVESDGGFRLDDARAFLVTTMFASKTGISL